MSRANYSDDSGNWALIRWRGAVAAAIRGKRGQAFLRELIACLDRHPRKELLSGRFADDDGLFCALGLVANERGLRAKGLTTESVAKALDIAPAMAQEIMFENDDVMNRHSVHVSESEAYRRKLWARIREWASSNLIEPMDKGIE